MSKQRTKQLLENQWDPITLGTVVKPVNVNEYEPLENGLSRYVAGDHIDSDEIFVKKFGDIERDKDVIGSAFHKKFSEGQLLFGTRRTYLRKAGLATFEGICANTTLVLDVKGTKFQKELLPFIFHWDKFIEYAVEKSVGSTNPYVRWRDLANFKFHLPAKPIQFKIAKILWSIEKSIESSYELSQKIQNYKNSMLKEIFTHGIGGTIAEEKHLIGNVFAEIPQSWKFKPLEKLSEGGTQNGIAISKNDYGDGVPIVGMTDLFANDILKPSNLKKVIISKKEEGKFALKSHDLIFARRSLNIEGSGKCVYVPKIKNTIVFESSIIRMTINKNKINPKFIFYFLQSELGKKLMKRITQIVAVSGIKSSDLSKFPIVYPENPKTQENVLEVFEKIDNYNN